jgi:hypothetical protein
LYESITCRELRINNLTIITITITIPNPINIFTKLDSKKLYTLSIKNVRRSMAKFNHTKSPI